MNNGRETIFRVFHLLPLSFVLMIGVTSTGLAGTDDMERTVGIPGTSQWQGLTMSAATGSAFRVGIPGFVIRSSEAGLIISVPGQASHGNPGEPALPAIATVCAAGGALSFSVEMLPPSWIEITNMLVAPVASRVLENVTTNAPTYREERRPSPSLYEADRFWPDVTTTIQEAWMGTQKLVRIECVPFQYNPVRKVLRYTPVLEGRMVPVKVEDTR
jgi:hypothetical protein